MIPRKHKLTRRTAQRKTSAARRRALFTPRVENLEDRRMLATITVDTPFDIVDPNDGLTSFREAVEMANEEDVERGGRYPGPDTIVFDESLQYGFIRRGFTGVNDITEEGGFLFPRDPQNLDEPLAPYEITSEITIDASSVGFISIGRQRGTRGLAIDSNGEPIDKDTDTSIYEPLYDLPLGRIFEVSAGSNATFINTLIVGGVYIVDGELGDEKPGGAGLKNEGTVLLIDSVVGSHLVGDTPNDQTDPENSGDGNGAIAQGGAIYNAPEAELTLENTHVGEFLVDTSTLTSLDAPEGFYDSEFLSEYLNGVGTGGDRRLIVDESIQTGVAPPDSTVRISGNVAQGHGAGIYNAGILAITDDSTIEGNRTLLDGAGIYNAASGVITISDSEVINHNTVIANGIQRGAGVFNQGELAVERSVIDGNIAHEGGGLYSSGQLTISESTISNNQVVESGHGAGLFDVGSQTTIEFSTLYNNIAGGSAGEGGAIFNGGNGELTIRNSTIANNVATGNGAGVFVAEATPSLTRLYESTIAFNSADGSGGGIYSASEIEFRNSLMAANTATSGGPDYFKTAQGTTTSLAANLIASDSGNDFAAGGDDLVNVDPLISPLADYGGSTLTVGLKPGSPAIDAGSSTSDPEAEDQRGAERNVRFGQDIGAVEFILPTSMRVDTLSGTADGLFSPGQVSLSDAIEWANSLPGHDTISLSDGFVEELREAGEDAVITLAETLHITDDLTIYGPGADLLSISGGEERRVFEIASGVTVGITDVAVVEGYTFTTGAEGGGAGILNAGDLTLRRVVMADNFADGNSGDGHGGAIMNRAGATLMVEDSALINNVANTYGGAIRQRGSAEIVNTTISENTAEIAGGIHSEGPDRIVHTTVANNFAQSFAGGYREFDGDAEFHYSIFADNNAAQTQPGDRNLALARFQSIYATWNVIQTNSDGRFSGAIEGITQNDNLVGVDPKLLPLSSVGGSTPIHRLAIDSPAVDPADSNDPPPENSLPQDQHGVWRDTNPDMGSAEWDSPELSGTIVVDSLENLVDGFVGDGGLTLPEALLFSEDSSVIEFDTRLFEDENGNPLPQQAIELREPLIVDKAVDLRGPGANRLQIDGTNVTDNGGLLQIQSDVVASIAGLSIANYANGAAILNSGDLTADSVYITESGIGVRNISSLSLTRSTLAYNSQFGLANIAGLASLTNTTVTENRAVNGVGTGLDNTVNGTLDLNHVTVAANDIGVNNSGGLILENSILALNSKAGSDPVDYLGPSPTTVGQNIVGSGIAASASVIVGQPDFYLLPSGTTSDRPNIDSLNTEMPIVVMIPGSLGIDQAVKSSDPLREIGDDQRGLVRDASPDIGAVEHVLVDTSAPDYDASQLVVDEFTDQVDGLYGAGQLSLREAILISNSTAGFEEFISIASIMEEPVHIELISGELRITDDVEIDGPGADWFRIDADGNSRIFFVDAPEVSWKISNIALTNGYTTTSGGGIYTLGDLELDGVELSRSRAKHVGGAIYARSGAEVTINNSLLDSNETEDRNGGAIDTDSPLIVDKTTFSNNRAGTVLNAAGNGGGSGGAIFSTNRAEISNSLFAYNQASNNGGAFRNTGAKANSSTAFIVSNSTFYGNTTGELARTVSNKNGGAIHTTNLELYHVTVANNQARTWSGGPQAYAGGIRGDGRLIFHNSIVSNNEADTGTVRFNDLEVHEFQATEFRSYYNIYGTVPVIGITSNVTRVADQMTNAGFVEEDGTPLLADYGGPTQTVAIRPNSDAVDAGAATSKPNSITTTRLTDARGEPLVDINTGDSIVDIGAYELQPFISDVFRYESLGGSQFGTGDALVYGFGFDDNGNHASVTAEPLFLGFEFDTGQKQFGFIEETSVLGIPTGKYGGSATTDFAGRFGFELGFYANSGSADVNFTGDVNHTIQSLDGAAVISSFVDVQDGGLYTVSPKVGAYADLVLELDSRVTALGCFVGCTRETELLDVNFKEKLEMFSLNRHDTDAKDRLLFLDAAGVEVAKAGEDEFYVPANTRFDVDREVTPTGDLSPVFDGDIRYFNLDVATAAGAVQDAIESDAEADAEREKRSAAKDISDAENEVAEAENRRLQAEEEIEKAKDWQKRVEAAGDTAHPLAKESADQSLKDAQQKRSQAIDAEIDAIKKRDKAKEDYKNRNKNNEDEHLCQADTGVTVSFGEAQGNLLGAEANIALETSAGKGPVCGTASKHVGSLQVTLPDVNLQSTGVDANGRLTASTDDFEPGSQRDNDRQIANAELDLAAFITALPLGQYNLQVGPLDLNMTTISYSVGPQFKVSQDVAAEPVVDTLRYDFFEQNPDPEVQISTCVDVLINGSLPDEGESCEGGGFRSVTFIEGSQVTIEPLDDILEAVRVEPTLEIAGSFSNEIGLEVDLRGAFEAFAISLSAYGIELFDIAPLLSHTHSLAQFDLGSVFESNFDLPTKSIDLLSFDVSFGAPDGKTFGTAWPTSPTDNENEYSVDVPPSDNPVYVATEVFDAVSSELYQELEVVVAPSVTELFVFDDSLQVEMGDNGVFTITGINQSLLNESGALTFALPSVGNDSTAVTVTRSNPITIDNAAPPETESEAQITQEDLDLAGTAAVINLDIDQDGRVSPLTDGVELVHHFNGTGVDQTTANYIEQVLNRPFLTNPDDPISERYTLDVDNDGEVNAIDAEILARYMSGFRGASLTEGLSTAADHEEVALYIDRGRVAASAVNDESFDDAISFTGDDLFALPDVSNLNLPLGSSLYSPYVSTASGTHAFSLNNFATSTTFENLRIDDEDSSNNGQVISSVPLGAPHEGAGTKDADAEIDKVTEQADYILGIQKPLFVQVPDSSGYEFELGNSTHTIRSLVIDRRIGPNTLLPDQFDLFFLRNGRWEYETTITASDSEEFISYAMPADVDRFRIVGQALPNKALHSAENGEASAQAQTTTFTIGLILEELIEATPELQVTELAARELFTTPDAIVGLGPAHEQTTPATNAFGLIRSAGDQDEATPGGTADVIPSMNGIDLPAIQMVSATQIEFRGHDNAFDNLTLSSKEGPLFAPLLFDGGFRDDSLVIDSAHGDGLTIDLAGRDQLRGVETIDLRGSGKNYLKLNVAAVRANAPFTKQLVVLANAPGGSDNDPNIDTIEVDEGWIYSGTRGIYDVYLNDDATLLVSRNAEVIGPPSRDRLGSEKPSGASKGNGGGLRSWHNTSLRSDTNVDGQVSALDAFLVVNHINGSSGFDNREHELASLVDTNNDGIVSPVDALIVINDLNRFDFVRTVAGNATSTRASGGTSFSEFGSTSRKSADGPSLFSEGNQKIQQVSAPSSSVDVSNFQFEIPFSYEALDGSATTGLHLRLHFDSSKLQFDGMANSSLSYEVITDGPTEEVFEDGELVGINYSPGFDGATATDSYVNLLWTDFGGEWPALAENLFTARFTPKPEFTSQTTIRFSGNPAAEYELDAEAVDVRKLVGTVAGTGIAYGNSAFADDEAIGIDKRAYRSGDGVATFANYTSHSRGINAVVVDIANLTGTPTAEDFTFRVGNDQNPAGWADAPQPTSIDITPGIGTDGSARVRITWPDNAIQNQWLEVTVLANANTGLATPDTHYWGNQIGETGNVAGETVVDDEDATLVRNNASGFEAVAIDSAFDINRDGRVNVVDHALVQANATGGSSLVLLDLGNGGNNSGGDNGSGDSKGSGRSGKLGTGEDSLKQGNSFTVSNEQNTDAALAELMSGALDPYNLLLAERNASAGKHSSIGAGKGGADDKQSSNAFTRSDFETIDRIVAADPSYIIPVNSGFDAATELNAISIALGLGDGGSSQGGTETAQIIGGTLDQSVWDEDPATGAVSSPAILEVSNTPALPEAASVFDLFGAGANTSVTVNSGDPLLFAELDLSSKTPGDTVILNSNFGGFSTAVGPNAVELDVTGTASSTLQITVLGDANGDGRLTNVDIGPFLMALTNRSEYETEYPLVDVNSVLDFTGDNLFTNVDIGGFLDALTGN